MKGVQTTEIWNRLPGSVEPQEIPDWQLVELVRRRVEAESRPGGGWPWREVLASLEAKP